VSTLKPRRDAVSAAVSDQLVNLVTHQITKDVAINEAGSGTDLQGE
jgi:hypothetical protein